MTFEERIKNAEEIIEAARECISTNAWAYLDDIYPMEEYMEFKVEEISYCSCCTNELRTERVYFDEIEQKLKDLNNEK